ncbi:transferase family protein [Metarhizium album ARSEF 1941]|uniref:Transferase family protein n=1 Tax=Metarhizium album (strain ARSEF 1941) TaxID=1081103 RepID=A0A0B2WMW6_METAS|nr:transferase family protein [Metarhizium album ARSEF 1941]KHN94355.1 transferase family protein [Metarhizium album ARSEF 1941]
MPTQITCASRSVHESAVGTLNTKTESTTTTPWHCSAARWADGQWISAPMGEFLQDHRLGRTYVDVQPSYFKERQRETGAVGITRATASYFEEARPRSASGHLGGARTSIETSPGSCAVSRRRQVV